MIVIPKINGKHVAGQDAGHFLLKDVLSVNAGEFAAWAVHSFASRLQQSCAIAVTVTDSGNDITLVKEPMQSSERYELEIKPDTITLHAANELGAIWGLATLYQMIIDARNSGQNKLDAQVFSDEPKFPHRGLLVDVGRHFFDVDEMKRIIEEMSVYKLNVLHWHLSEDQGWRIESKVYPRLHESASNGQYYTQQQIKEIVQYAKERGVEIIPEFDIPGHSSAAISAYKELSCFDEEIAVASGYGVFRVVMCPGKDSTYQWIFNLLDELVELFPSPYFHMGGDECPRDRWERCPHCNERMKQHQLESYDDLQGYFMNQINAYLKGKGKTMIGWSDFLKASNVSQDIVIQYWLENTAESYVYPYFAAGQKMIFSDMFNFYFDYPHCMVKLRKTYEYDPKIREHTQLSGDHILGLEGTIWTERVLTNEQLESMISLRIQALAEAAWTIDRDYDEFLERLKAHLQPNHIAKLISLPFEEVALTDEQAMVTALKMMSAMKSEMSETFTDAGISDEEKNRIGQMFNAEIFGDTDLREFAKKMGLS